jgi:hypothetical protein
VNRALAALAALAAAVLAAACLSVLSAGPATAATTPTAVRGAAVSKNLRSAVTSLRVAAPRPSGYSRTKFKLWDDADHDCRDTRAEVLAKESTRKVTGTCTIRTGRWLSYYDGRIFTKASGLDIDHLVPLKEAWASGARSWTAAKREAYANDLSEVRTLVAVSAHANRSKGDRDPARWLPTLRKCRYINQWVVVKLRWGLTVDRAEKAALVRIAAGCPDVRLTTYRAKVVGTSTTGHGGGGGGTTTSGGSGGGLDPQFDTCTEAISHGYGPYVKGKDPEYGWYEDRDHDGVVCE